MVSSKKRLLEPLKQGFRTTKLRRYRCNRGSLSGLFQRVFKRLYYEKFRWILVTNRLIDNIYCTVIVDPIQTRAISPTYNYNQSISNKTTAIYLQHHHSHKAAIQHFRRRLLTSIFIVGHCTQSFNGSNNFIRYENSLRGNSLQIRTASTLSISIFDFRISMTFFLCCDIETLNLFYFINICERNH